MSRLLFVCGFPSGGTDLFKTILNAHPDIHLNGEMPLLKNIAKHGYSQDTVFTDLAAIERFQRVLKRLNVWGNIENVDHDFSVELEAGGELGLNAVLQTCFSQAESLIWGNKTPQNTENIALFADLFPDARFLIVVRDVREVCLSWRNKWGKDMIWCAAKWAKRMRKGWEGTRVMPQERSLFVRFEDILAETEVCCRKMCAFLDLPFSGRMLEHHQYTKERIDGKLNYGSEIIRENKNKWRGQLTAATVERIEQIAFGTMAAFGYEVDVASGPKPISLGERARGTWNDAWALLLVGNRASRRNSVGAKMRAMLFELRKRFPA